ncbi:hypothetical protein [Nocardioides sp. Leaf374]|uniref:hypothetical protein n=1 Tax=Nocardioides sp. Leaf374 TaxID=2876560 RepID=UPI001E49B664|nr:hypothetical protein [Nocardioides sp. Leaf374]
MPDSTWVRVLDNDTGHQRTIRRSALPHGAYTELPGDAIDPLTGEPLAPVYAVAPDEAATAAASEPAEGYMTWLKADLEQEVERRNDARGDEQQFVVVEAPRNKKELAAALSADDERAESLSGTDTDGQQTDTTKENASA